ncbi:hypothetical protein DSO57_1001763 [Entomophthora muscae]|uniref:Uncharacterized protein n=1 Tax=Entomophthora muscae TaxID=34485 RepID=A0ACC2T8J4_9FUNG|nr:hypothetical protein DSO57_1001763 [Entomophthora muscae]
MIEVPPLLFKDKYNYLPAYFVPMTLPSTLQSDHPMETLTAAKTTSTQLFGVLYITLTGMVDTMVPNSGLWSLLGKSISYIINLAPILWWALLSGLAVFCPEPTNASTYTWLPDTVVSLLCYIMYNMILSQIITGRWGPVLGTLLLVSPNVTSMPQNLSVFPAESETETVTTSQC